MDYKQTNSINQKTQPTGADRRKAAGAGAGLGIVTKTTSPLFEVVTNDGEVLQFNQSEDGKLTPIRDPQKVRAERWQLKSVVNRLLPESRTSKCHLFRAPATGGGLSGIQVHATTEHNRAYFTGLMSCGSVWNCPVCSAKVSERRRSEMQQALDNAQELGLKPFLITLTNSHGIGDDLFEMKEKQRLALKKMSNGKNSIKNTLLRNGINQVGFIRTYEVTHGNINGFHPHFHLIVFIDSNLPSSQIQQVLFDVYFLRWSNACANSSLPAPSKKHGVDVKCGDMAAKYVTKWGLAEEMTKTLHKKNKKYGLSPWGLLRAIFDNDNPDYPRDYASGLFYVYSRAMSGSRQLYWSNGLRDFLSLGVEIDDVEIANQITDETSLHLSTISWERWKQIRRSRSESQVLDIAETNPNILNTYLERFDSSLACLDSLDPLRLNIPDVIIDPLKVVNEYLLQRKLRIAKNNFSPPLLFLYQKLGLTKNLIIPMNIKPA